MARFQKVYAHLLLINSACRADLNENNRDSSSHFVFDHIGETTKPDGGSSFVEPPIAIFSVDNFLKAGITYAAHVIIVKSSEAIVEEHLADCSTIITVQKIHKMFPKLRMTTELVHASNMRFVYFNPESEYALAQSEVEKQERKRGSTMPFIFRLPFAQGGVFSANMMDRLLYQAIIKPFVVDFTRLLLGLDQSENGGFLTSFEVTASDLWLRTYGKLYKKLTSSAGDIPIGIFRTQPLDKEASSCHCTHSIRSRNKEMWHHVLHRMRTMGMTSLDETKNCKPDNTVSFVLINPSVNLKLETGDIIYVLRAPVSQEENWRVNPRRGLRKSTNVTEVSVEVDA